MPDPSSDEAFARYVRRTGMASEVQIQSARQLQSGGTSSLPLGEALVRSGAITAAQREAVEQKLGESDTELPRIGGYQILRKLGEGGMGAVYLARREGGGPTIAVKMLSGELAKDEEFVRRFHREAGAAARLAHENIARGIAAGEDQGRHFYVMEFCEGESLKKRLARLGVLAPEEALSLVAQVARGLKFAHDQGFIHRDIKPDNVIVTPAGTAKILDLGLTKSLKDPESTFRTVTGAMLGTPHYISPEQARGEKDLDGRTDQYSLGATFYHLVSGAVPFSGTSIFEIVRKHLSEQLPDPRDVRPGIPEPVVHVIRRMMAKEPKDRYPDCGELLVDLDLVRAGSPPRSRALDPGLSTLADPAAPGSVTRKRPAPSGRRKTALRAGGIAAAALVSGLLWASLRGSPAAPSDPPPAVPEKPPPFGKDSSPGGKKPAPANPERTELLPLVDLARHSRNDPWTRTPEGLVSPATGTNQGTGSARFRIPYSPPEEYEVTLVVERLEGEQDLILGLSYQGQPFAVVLDGWFGQGSSGAFLDGSWQKNPSVPAHVLPLHRPVRLVASVRRTGFELSVDGTPFPRWPAYERLGMPDSVRFSGRSEGLIVGSIRSVFRISSVSVIALSGKGRIVD